MARLEKTIQDYQEQLKKKGIKNIPEFIQSILDADITNGKYSRFLLDCYLADKFLEEDLQGGLESTIGQAISLFHKNKTRLPEGMRSVYKYNSPGDLWNAVKQFDGELSGKKLKQDVKEKIYSETEFLYEDKETGFKIISPLSEESAKWWGKGTRWCTSADKNNQFWNYAEKAPLLILLMPDGEKLQFWKGEYSIQFMDEADNSVKKDYIEQHWDNLKPLIVYYGGLHYIPEKFLNEDIWQKILDSDISYFSLIPEKYLTEALCLKAVKKDGCILDYIPEELRTYEMCKLAIQQNGNALSYIEEELRTDELLKIALNQNGIAIRYFPKNKITEEDCKIAVQKNDKAYRFLPDNMKTEELRKIALETEKKREEKILKNQNLQKNIEDVYINDFFQISKEYYSQEKKLKLITLKF